MIHFLLLFLISSANASYQLQITNRQYPNGGVSGVLDPIADSLELKFNNTLSTSNNAAFLTEVGNANAGATRSILAPGVVGETRYSGSFGLNAALSGGTSSSVAANSLPAVGVAAQSGVTLGANGEKIKLFQGLNPKRVMYYVSFYTKDFSSYFKNGITIDSLQFSTGLSYRLNDPIEWVPAVIRFNGIRVTSGFSYGSFSGSYTTPFTLSSGGIDMKSDVTLTVDSKVYTLTNEATAGVRFLYFLDLFMGLGVDFNFGSTSLAGKNSNGSVSASNAAGVTIFTGDATVTGTAESAAPSIAQLRLLMGTQVNLGPLGIYAQAQVSTPSVYSLNLGAKISF